MAAGNDREDSNASMAARPGAGCLRIFEAARPGDKPRIDDLLARKAVIPHDVDHAARAIVDAVRERGDDAVREYTKRFERRELARLEVDLSRQPSIDPAVQAALERAARRIADFHREQLATRTVDLRAGGIRLALRTRPLERVGVYVPGGTARYPSSVLMTAVPAAVAGVREIIMVTPGASPETLAAARIAGVHRVFEIGGAQAVAALAYGTESVPRVDKIVGPGNIYVAAAKRIVFGDVDIDAVAGPSEVLIVADGSVDPRFTASDLIAQAEHDVHAAAILVVPSRAHAEEVAAAIEAQLADLPRAEIAKRSLAERGAAIVVADLDAAIAVSNRFAPEHLGLHVADADADAVAARCTNAGAIFLGAWTPEAVGDYLAGPNHVLPTGGSARFASPLGVYDYMKHTTLMQYDRAALAADADDIVRLAKVEGLEAHARSVSLRLESEP